MSKTVTLRLDDATYAELSEAAEAEGRPLADMIGAAALAAIRQGQFVYAAERVEIAANEALLARLQAGSRDAQRIRGRFV